MDLPHSLYKFYTTQSTQTEYSSNTESTQTYFTTSEIAIQTEIEDRPTDVQHESQWTDNPLKRKMLITFTPFESKVSKTEDQEIQNISELNTNDNFVETCQNDDENTIFEFTNPEVKIENKKVAKKIKKTNEPKNKSKGKKGKEKDKRKNSKKNIETKRKKKKIDSTDSEDSNDTQDSSENVAYDSMMANRLEDQILHVQNQWKIHEKKYRKGTTTNETESDIKLETVKERMKQGRSYGNELKFLSLNLFYSNPTAYKALRQKLNLPTEKTLRRIEVGVTTKLTDTVIECLKLMVSKQKEEEHYCVVCASIVPLREEIHKIANTNKSIGYHEIDEIQGTEPAVHCLVILLRGLYSDWKQPLISCFLKENFCYIEVNKWLDNIINTLLQIGLKVVAYTTNENEHLINMAKERNVSTEQPYFFVNNHKIYYIFDILHLLNSIRNLLINYYFRYIDLDGSEMIASWFDIEKLFETDKPRYYKLAPKLTEGHIRPNDLEKTRSTLSMQVFSKTVATGVMTCIEQKHLTNRSFGTVKFVELLNDVFDILNSIDEKEIEFKSPFSFKDFQITALDKMVNVLTNLKVITKNYEDITNTISSMKCFEITIRSVLNLAGDLKHYGFDYICTRNLNLEHLDVFFESMRKKWGPKTSAVLFYAGFRNFYLENVIKKSESHSSCGLDKDLIAVLLKDNKENTQKDKNFNPFYKYL